MDEPVEDEKIIGIPKGKYLKVAYTLLLVSSAFGVLTSILGLFNIGGVVSGLSAVSGIAGLVLVFVAFYAFSEKFSALEIAHFKYIGFLFFGFVVVGVAFAMVFGGTGLFYSFIAIILNSAALTLMYAGFRLFQNGIETTKENVINELKAIQSTIQKTQK